MNPEDVDNTPGEQSTSAPSVQDQINSLVADMIQDDQGKWHIPEDKLEGVPEPIAYAAKLEKRFRDTQGAYTKSRQQIKELETTNESLVDHVIKNATLHLTDEEREELYDLKTSNPEAWRAKLNEHEENARKIQENYVNDFKAKGKQASESISRAEAYAEFTERTGIELSDAVFDNQLPAAYKKNLDSGEWTFDQFLAETEKFLKPSGVVKGSKDKPENPKDLSKLPGGSEPSDEALSGDALQSYSKETY